MWGGTTLAIESARLTLVALGTINARTAECRNMLYSPQRWKKGKHNDPTCRDLKRLGPTRYQRDQLSLLVGTANQGGKNLREIKITQLVALNGSAKSKLIKAV